jgi:hypothetical protein
MTNRVVVGYTPAFNSRELDFLEDGDYEISVCFSSAALTNATTLQTALDFISPITERNIPIYAELEAVTNDIWGAPPTFTKDTTVAEYEALFGASLTTIEALPSFAGYAFEGSCDNAVIWARDRVDLVPGAKLLYYWSYDFFNPPSLTATVPYVGSNDMDWRVSQMDEVIYEQYMVSKLPQLTAFADFIRDNYATPLGVITAWEHTALNWWHDTSIYGTPILSIDERKKRIEAHLNDVKRNVGAFDNTDLIAWTTQTNTIDALRFMDVLNLTGAATKGAESIGFFNSTTPIYMGAAYCRYDISHEDTFANTGNEIILLKNVDYDGGCRVHDITVISTDTLTHEDYTLALSPDRGTILGPYSLDDYGALPTIEYDNTNLYVSVLKVEPTA